MKVILLQDIRGKGKKGQCIEAAEGYARNYLLPRKLAVEANASNLNTMRMNDKAAAEKAARERAEAMEIAKALKSATVVIRAKGGGAGKLFGSVTAGEAADALKAQYGIEIDKRKILVDEPIRTVGTYTLKCKLGYEITGELRCKVEELEK